MTDSAESSTRSETSDGRRARAWVGLGTVAVGILNYAYLLLVTGFLPASDYSVFAAGQGLLLVVGTVSAAAVPWMLAREIAMHVDDLGARRRAVWFALVVNLGVGIACGLTVAGASAGYAPASVLPILAIAALGYFVLSTGIGWAQGTGRFGLVGLILSAEAVVKVVSGIVLLELGAGLEGALLASVIGTFSVAAVVLYLMRSEIRYTPGAIRVRALWHSVAGMVGIQALITLASVLDVVLAPTILGTASEVAPYQLASSVGRVPLFIAGAIAIAAFPALTRYPGDRTVTSDALGSLLCVVAGAWALGATVPAELIRDLLPAEYGATVDYLPFTLATGGAFALATFYGSLFKAANSFGATIRTLALGALVSTIAIITGALTSGVVGVAVGALIGALVTSAMLAYLSERRWPGAQRPKVLGPISLLLAAIPLQLASGSVATWMVIAAVVSVAALVLALDPDRLPRAAVLREAR